MKCIPRSLLLLLCALCLAVCAFVRARAGGDDWRPVTPEELGMKTPKVDPDADAEAIFWEVRIDDSSAEDLSLQHYVRVKIFTERGREKYSKFDVPFTKGMKIKDVAARVTKPDGSTVEIQKQDIFEREIIKASGLKVKAKSFAVPNVESGVIVEYRYREVISDAGASGMRLKFQRDIPVQNLSYYYKPYNKKTPNYQSFNFDDTKFVEDQKGFWIATRKNVPALKEEPRMPPEDQVVPWMLLQSVRINITNVSLGSIAISIKDPSNPAIYWGSVGTEKAFLARFMNKPDKEIKKVADEITATAATPEEKLQKLYHYCQTEISNTTFDTTLTDDQRKKLPEIKSLSDVLKRKAASAQYVDMLFGAMANALGYETRVALCGDRSEMFFKPEMTNESFIHPAAIAVKVGEDWKFFNPGLSLLPYGNLVWYEEGVWALLVGEKNFSWMKTPISTAEKSVAKRTGKLRLLDDGTLEGEVRIEYADQLGLGHKLDNYDKSASKREEDFKAELKKRMSTAEVSDLVIENVTDPNKPVVYAFKIRVPGYAQKTGKRLFLQPGLFEHGEPAVFSGATRKYDIYFHYPWSEKDHLTIDLPAGFALDNADSPAPINPAMTQGICGETIKMGVTTDGHTLIYDRTFFFGGGGVILFPARNYSALKTLFDMINQANDHTITLKQTAAISSN
ncbi:MAG: hypothetical protein QOH41_4075 [Blastocatellia bacterium]|nr:hypothetical protein [Blastocatellia bacterium]